jgi:hypothetical protein
MLKVLPIQTKAEQEALCLRCNIKYDPDLLAYAASVDGETVGICQFKVTGDGGIIYDIATLTDRDEPADRKSRDASDFEALFVMGRGALNFIDLCGVKKAIYIGQATDEALIRAIGFKKDPDGVFRIDLEGFFTDHCH